MKGINTWAVLLVRYSDPIFKWTSKELKQMDLRTKKLMTMLKASHPRDSVADYMCQEQKEGEDMQA